MNTSGHFPSVRNYNTKIITLPCHACCLRNNSATQLRRTGYITVIGLLPPKDVYDDPFLLQLFKAISAAGGAKHYVSPSRDDCTRASEFGLTAHQLPFDAFPGLARGTHSSH
jgi:hypothetical protein